MLIDKHWHKHWHCLLLMKIIYINKCLFCRQYRLTQILDLRYFNLKHMSEVSQTKIKASPQCKWPFNRLTEICFLDHGVK